MIKNVELVIFSSKRTRMIEPNGDEFFMKKAFEEALKARSEGEIPVGAVVVANGQIIARAHNLTQTLNDVTAHAEMQAITAAADYIGGKYLKGCTLYVTLEPCIMCGGALFWSQIDKVVFGSADEKRGASSKGNLYHPKTKVVGGIMESECANILLDFFKDKRE